MIQWAALIFVFLAFSETHVYNMRPHNACALVTPITILLYFHIMHV